MRVVTIGPFDWAVRADWLGCERTVHVGSLPACLAFIASLEVTS